MSLAYYESLFMDLNVNRSHGRASPHKMCMLLAVIELIGVGKIRNNQIFFDDALKSAFTSSFDKYRGEDDRDNPYLPFFHMKSEPFWHHKIKYGQEESYEALKTATGSGSIDKHIAYAYLDDALYALLLNQYAREYLKAALESTLDEKELRHILEQPKGWDWLECEVTVKSYFDMLDKQLVGEIYNKTEYRRKLLPFLNNRSETSIEFKHQNISAILVELGFPYIPGYKPAYNYQKQLKEVVEVYLVDHYSTLVKESEQFIESGEEMSTGVNWDTVLDDEPEKEAMPKSTTERKFNPRQYNYAERESSNRKLGAAGESFVLEYERFRMEKSGRPDLIGEIEWTSKEKGDGAGYDIRSFNPAKDEELFIEVKTTNSGKYQPFYISDNEVAFAEQNPDRYALYRVFQFKVSPKLFTLHGKISEHVHLLPKSYRASFRGL